MNYPRLAVAAFGATVAYVTVGFLLLAVLPIDGEIRRFPAVYRGEEAMTRVAPVGMAALVLAMTALVSLYAMTARAGSSPAHGVRFGVLVGVFASGSFMLHNYVSLNISLRLALIQAFAYFAQWVVTGVVIALIYRPRAA